MAMIFEVGSVFAGWQNLAGVLWEENILNGWNPLGDGLLVYHFQR